MSEVYQAYKAMKGLTVEVSFQHDLEKQTLEHFDTKTNQMKPSNIIQ